MADWTSFSEFKRNLLNHLLNDTETRAAQIGDGNALQVGNNLTDVASASAARTALGLDTAALQPASHFRNASYKATTAAFTPDATHAVDGAAVHLTPDSGFAGIMVSEVDIIYGGTFGSETATVAVTATFDDASTATFTHTATATGTHGYDFNGSDVDVLTKSGHVVTDLSFVVQSTIDSSTVSVTATVRGTESH